MLTRRHFSAPAALTAGSVVASPFNLKAVLGEARSLGVEQYFVDQDETALPIAKCLRVNWKYLSRLNF